MVILGGGSPRSNHQIQQANQQINQSLNQTNKALRNGGQ
jgi:hypothetical protein